MFPSEVVYLTCSWTFTIALFLRNIYKCTVELSIRSFLLIFWNYFLFPKSMSFPVSLLRILSNDLWVAQARGGGWAGAGFASNQPEQFASGEDLTLEAKPAGMDCTWQIPYSCVVSPSACAGKQSRCGMTCEGDPL